jgi:hypothetical protein
MRRACKANIENLSYNHAMENDSPNPGGRPSKRTSETEKKILDSIARGLPLKTAAALAGIAESTLHEWRKLDAGFDKAVAKAEAQPVMESVQTIRAAGRDDWKASSWFLERRHPELFGQPSVQFNQKLHLENNVNHIGLTAVEIRELFQVNKAQIDALLNGKQLELPSDGQDQG